MAKVTPQDDMTGSITDRGVRAVSVNDQMVYYRQKIVDAANKISAAGGGDVSALDNFALASQIYGQKPGCWQDYFKRSTRNVTYVYGNFDEGQNITNVLTGSQLATQLVGESINSDPGHPFDPKCFCLFPCDPSGQVAPVYANLNLYQGSPANYAYEEKHRVAQYDANGNIVTDPFCSSIGDPDKYHFHMNLTADYFFPRYASDYFGQCDFTNFQLLCIIPAIWFKHTEEFFQNDLYLSDFNQWMFVPKGYGVDTSTPALSAGFSAYYIPITNPDTLCGARNLYIDVIYSTTRIAFTVHFTDTAPFYDLYFGNQFLAKVGVGDGNFLQQTFEFNRETSAKCLPDTYGQYSLDNSPLPPPNGLHDGMALTGRIYEPEYLGCTLPPSPVCSGDIDPKTGCTISYYDKPFWDFEIDDTIHVPGAFGGHSRLSFMVMLKRILPDKYMWHWPFSTYGQVYLFCGPSFDELTNGRMLQPTTEDFVPTKPIMCFDYLGTGCEAKCFRVQLRTELFSECNGSLLGIPGTYDPCDKNLCDNVQGSFLILDKDYVNES